MNGAAIGDGDELAPDAFAGVGGTLELLFRLGLPKWSTFCLRPLPPSDLPSER
jgi:hypothetical protein